MPPRSTLVYTAMRPIRALTMVACPDGLDWRVPFIAALRAQVLIWGGQSNLLVPADADVLANPLLWAMHKTLDPEAVLLHPGSWGDIKDLVPARFDAHESDLRGQLESQGSTEPAIDDFLQRVPAEPWSEGLDADDLKPLVDRGAMLNFDGAPEFGVTSWRPGVGYPWVSLLDFPSADLPKDVAMGSGGGNLDFDLMLASTRGQVSSAGRAALDGQGTSVTVTEISSASEVAALVFPDRSKSTSHDAPFELAHYGCSWFSRPTIHAETAVVVVGDDPWDFAVAYALSRLTGAAYWLPTSLLNDPLWMMHLSVRGLQSSRWLRGFVVTSVSSPDLATQAASALQTGGNQVSTESDALALFPESPRRLLCTRRANRATRVSIDDGLMALEMPVPDLQTSRHPTGLHWMTDVIADGWAVIRDSKLSSLLVPETQSLTTRARTISDGVSVLCPGAVVLSNVELEAQVPRPTIRVATVVDQVSAIGSERGFRCVPSDKGLYTLEAAELVGGLRELMDLVCDGRWLTLLRALSSTKQSGHPGRWSASDKRRYFRLNDVMALSEKVELGVSTASLVARGVLRRGLRHTCPRCRFASWFDQEEIGSDLRCARCRRATGLHDSGWEGENEPGWRYRLHEILWQFISNHGDLALRAVDSHMLPSGGDRNRVPWGLGVEMDVFSPGGRRLGETDLTLTLEGSLWIGEAKSNATLGSDGEVSLKRLRRVAEHLRADGVALISETRPFPDGQLEIARKVFAGAVPELAMLTVDAS